jgi:hypothetical protein
VGFRGLRRGAFAAALGTALACGALYVPAAHGAAQWLGPGTDVSQNAASNFTAPIVGMGPNGDVAIIYELGATLRMVTRSPGGTFSPHVDLTTTMVPGGRKAVAVDGSGNAFAIWPDTTGGTGGSASSIRVAVKAPGAAPNFATLETTLTPDEPNIALTPSGAATAVWRQGTNLRMARRPAGGSFGSAFTLINIGGGNAIAEQATLDVNAGGDAAVGFRSRTGGGFFRCRALFQPAGSNVASTAVFDPGSNGGDDDASPGVGVDNAGNASVLCGRAGGTIKVSDKPAGSNVWSSIAAAAGTVDSTAGSGNPRLAWNDSGQQAATWTTGALARLVAATRSGFGAFASQEIGAPAGGVSYSPGEVAIDPNGVGLTVFNRNAETRGARSSGASWTATNHVESTGGPTAATVEVDDQGNGAAAYQRTDSGTTNIRGIGFDAAGPKLNNISYPATATVGESVPFSVQPLDVWSNVASTNWAFGEGSNATGTSGTFAYSAAGNFTTTVTSTDSIGNSSSASRNISVSQGAGGGGGDGGGGGGGGGGSDAQAPILALEGKTKQKLDGSIEVGASCDEACTVEGDGTLVLKSDSGKRATSKFGLKGATRQLEAGEKATIKIGVPKKAQKAGKRALRSGGKDKARLALSASDSAGNGSAAIKRSVTLKSAK